MAKKIGFFFIFGFAAIGALALLAYLILNKVWPLVPCLLVICALAYPKAKEIYDFITDANE